MRQKQTRYSEPSTANIRRLAQCSTVSKDQMILAAFGTTIQLTAAAYVRQLNSSPATGSK